MCHAGCRSGGWLWIVSWGVRGMDDDEPVGDGGGDGEDNGSVKESDLDDHH